MKIAFLCGSLEPGRDGVGDYTRRLAGELNRRGHPVMAVALNDPYVSESVFEIQQSEITTVPTLRLPSVSSWNQRINDARHRLDDFQPDWLSIQFVTFGYHRKGLCAGLGAKFAAMNSKAAWHVMFHELWLGLGEQAPLKHRVMGALQRVFIQAMIRRLRPQVVHTQTEPYRQVLCRVNIPATVLPLISNVPCVQGDGWAGLLEPLLADSAGIRPDRAKLYLAGIFGSVHPEWNVEQAVNLLIPLVRQAKKRLVLVFLGRNNLNSESFVRLKSLLRDRAEIISTGEKSVNEISRILQSLDVGLATTPRRAIQKSGSAAAMLEHGLPVLVTRDDWRLRGIETKPEETSSRLIFPEQFAGLNVLPVREPVAAGNGRLKGVADQLLARLQ
jgi:hypothetical protein